MATAMTKHAAAAGGAGGRGALRGACGPLGPYKVQGWGFDPAAPGTRVAVELLLDGAPIGETTADLYRPNLVEAGIGDGHHGFAFNTDRAMPVEAPERVTVRLRSPATGRVLELKPRTAPLPAKPAAPPAAAPMPAPAAALPPGAPERPVFILGAARSGTSAMAQALFRNTRYAGHGEGHLLDLLPRLVETVERHYAERAGDRRPGINTMIAHVPPERMARAIREMLAGITRELFPGGHWLDKTPRASMIRAVPLLRRIWPEARFIFMRRRAIENLASAGRKFPQEGFAAACQRWADCLEAWSEVRRDLAGRAIEVDWLAMAREPARVAEAVGGLLDLSAEEVLRLRQALQVDLPERTSDRFAEVHPGLPADMDPAQRQVFEAVCAPWMRRAGYAMTERYWQPGEEARALILL